MEIKCPICGTESAPMRIETIHREEGLVIIAKYQCKACDTIQEIETHNDAANNFKKYIDDSIYNNIAGQTKIKQKTTDNVNHISQTEFQRLFTVEHTSKIAMKCCNCNNIDVRDSNCPDGFGCSVCKGGPMLPIGYVKPSNNYYIYYSKGTNPHDNADDVAITAASSVNEAYHIFSKYFSNINARQIQKIELYRSGYAKGIQIISGY